MDKLKPIKRTCTEDQRTKPKQPPSKVTANQKSTVVIRNRVHNQLTSKLISQSTMISSEESVIASSDSSDIEIIDQLCIYGNIKNLSEIDENTMKRHNIYQGWMFEVQDYKVIFAGRHQIEFKNGMQVALYVPPIFKIPINSQTSKFQILIQRKLKNQMNDPMQYPYIIIDPNNSIYPTYICSWIECKRKIALQNYIKYNQPIEQCMILGNCIHRYLQWLIRKQVPQEIPTQVELRKLYQSFIYEMYLLDLHFEIFIEKIDQGIVNLVQWYQQYVIKGHTIQLNKWDKKYLRISRVLGSQVMIKSKYFGIRGKVDALFEGQYWDEKQKVRYMVSIPFELKTGKKPQLSHKKQIDFYNFLVRQKNNMPVLGLLYYSQSNLLEYRVQNALVCFENVNIHRNKIIINILNIYQNPSIIQMPSLPETLDQCKLCDVTIECAVNRLQPNTLKDLEDIAEQVPQKYHPQIKQKIKKLNILELKYLKKWTQLLHLEECKERKENEDKSKRFFQNKFKLSTKQMDKFMEYSSGDTLCFTVTKPIQSHEMSQQMDSYFQAGQKLRIFIPTIRLSECCRITKTSKTTKIFQMQVQIKSDAIKFNKNKCMYLAQEQQQIQHIDVEMEKYENSFYSYTRGYCYKFVTEAQNWLKKIVIEENYQKSNAKQAVIQKQPQQKLLNNDQALAFQKCINIERFCLVQGMPGTGKTQLILKLMQYYYRTGKTILITSYTNQSLSNILERQINNEKVIPIDNIIRQGSRFGIGSYESLSSQSQQAATIDDYKNYFKTKKVWFVTISSLYIQHLPKKFDVVIFDEASQCLEANCLEALMKADKFILIGDQNQLQPVVKSPIALEKGMQVSLFERLCSLYKSQKVILKKQYRMSPAIMNLTNSLVYNGQLQLAKEDMEHRVLKISQQWQQSVPKFLHEVIDPSKSLRFINYDNTLNLFAGDEKTDARRIKRLLQIKITCCLYKYFRNLGIERKDILIISAYNSLVHQIVSALKKQNLIESNSSDVLTIDKSQGTDKEVIIFIFHQGNKELIENYRRLNVALTRAKNKFIIVGSYKQLKSLATWTGKLADLLIPDRINVQKEFLQGILNSTQ